MGAFDDIDNITVPDPEKLASEEYRAKHGEHATEEEEYRKRWKWDAGEQVILKGRYLGGDHEAVQNANSPAAKANEGKNQEVKTRIGSGHMKLLERMIVGWTLYKRGHPVELNPKNIRRLPSNYMTPLLERIDEISVGMTQEEQEDFLPSSNGLTKESSQISK